MKPSLLILILLFVVTLLQSQNKNIKEKNVVDVQLLTGLNRGLGFSGNILLHDFSSDFPFYLRFGIGYTFLDPGKASDVRRIFINNATNGVPEKKGSAWDFRMDFMKPVTLFKHPHSFLFLGPRYSKFKGNFKYVGGNEDFDIVSKQWGMGFGGESHYQLKGNLQLVLTAGLDYYFPSKLQGHDTSYSPNNDNVNARTNTDTDEKYVFKDADKAVTQPKLMPRFMIGIVYDL